MRSPLLTYKQVAEICGVSVSNVRKWVMTRQLKVIRLGHRLSRVTEEDFEEFIKKRRTK